MRFILLIIMERTSVGTNTAKSLCPQALHRQARDKTRTQQTMKQGRLR